MIIGVPKETDSTETRSAMVPANVERLRKLGAAIRIETGAGLRSHFPDRAYASAGASVVSDRDVLLGEADILLRVRQPPADEVNEMKPGCVHLSFLDPFREIDLLGKLATRGVSTISLEMLPRSTRAQKMDALTSQASLAGYVAALLGAEYVGRIFPMMMTAAGTISPARVFIIGAGVAGLQAIATARRLGARVEAFDTRPVVEEQVRSLGARFLKIDIGETGQTEEGYARPLTPEQLEAQRLGIRQVCVESDVVITTAQVFGRRAPVIVTADMIEAMRPGSVIVDLAIESGGNVEGSVLGKVIERHGVNILGFPNLPGRVPVHASQVYSSNLVNFLEEFWDCDQGRLVLRPNDDIIRATLLTHRGEICHTTFKQAPPRETNSFKQVEAVSA